MCRYNDLVNLIYKYYPKNCSFEEKYYQSSKEYKNYIIKVSNVSEREIISCHVHNEIKSVLPNNYISKWNNSSFPSVHFSVLLHENQDIIDDDEVLLDILGGCRYDLHLYISLLEKFYYMFVDETLRLPNNQGMQFSVLANSNSYKKQIDKLDDKLNALNYKKLSSNVAHKLVPYVETELLEEGEVKIFNCLFADIVTKF